MFGKNAKQILCGVKRYVMQYGDEKTERYLNAILYERDADSGNTSFRKASRVEENENVFVAGIENMLQVELDEEYRIPSDSRSNYLRNYFSSLYNKNVTINDPGDSNSFHICFYVPIYDFEVWKTVEEMIGEIEAIPQDYVVDLFLLPYDLAFLFDDDLESLPNRIEQYAKVSQTTIQEILKSKGKLSSLSHLIMLQNCNESGFSLDFNEESFTRVLGEYALLSLNNYREIFPQAAEDRERPIHALGLCTLSFDKYYFVQYLLHKTYVSVLDSAKVCQESVDVNKVSSIVKPIVESNVKVFSSFYEKHIAPLLENGVEQDVIISQVADSLNGEINRLTDEFQSYISDPSLSLPEKKATLAQLLGEDDSLLSGYLYDRTQLTIDDCSCEALDFFVEANNKLVKCSRKDDTEQEKEMENDLHESAVITENNGLVITSSELVKELKKSKIDVRELTNYIRLKTDELGKLNIQMENHQDSQKRLTPDGFVFDGDIFQLQPFKEELFEEDYTPHTNLLASVDLRSCFTSIKNQGKMGACTAFALVSIMESILKRNKKSDLDLSEQFIYYNVRNREGNAFVDKGSSLYGVVKTMTDEGVCLESYFPYNPNDCSQRPAQAAYDDAANRKIVKALNVKLTLDDVKSALCDGYPVAIVVKIFDSFYPRKGFIPMPSESEMKNGDSGYHTMVIVGFNDEAKFFVVRNSWGKGFGDNGYCYMPYSYFENMDLFVAACIVTKVNDASLTVNDSNKKMSVSFNMTDSVIKHEILSNLIYDAKNKLQDKQEVVAEKSKEYNLLFQRLGNNSVRQQLCEGTEKRLNWEGQHLSKEKDQVSGKRIHELSDFDKSTKKMKAYYFIAFAFVVLVYALICWAFKSIKPLTCRFSLYVYGVISLLSVAFWALLIPRRKRERYKIDQDYKDELADLSTEIVNREKEAKVTHLKSHIAGMIIDSLYKLNANLYSKYNGMHSCVGNLSMWRMQENDVELMPLAKDPFLTIISNGCLDRFFDSEKDKLIKGIDLSEMFHKQYSVKEEDVVKFKNNLKKSVIEILSDSIKDFSITSYMLEKTKYPYVENANDDLPALLSMMDKKSRPFVKLNTSVATNNTANTNCRMMYVYGDLESQRPIWDNVIMNSFSDRPMLHKSDSPYKCTMLQMNGVSIDDVAMMKLT
ncbi:MAG: C1 family peptidase [Bacteroidales bacterium]|nr:C1 family peptidase [Bacteroidales bacterium]